MPSSVKIDHGVLIPGNGCGNSLNGCMWYPWLADKLTSSLALTVPTSSTKEEEDAEEVESEKPLNNSAEKDTARVTMRLRGFPNHLEAYEDVWKPFAIEKLGLSETSILVGHSSGAACSLRLMEERPIAACVLVAAYNSDMGDDLEAESGYFSRPFDYQKMVKNCPFIIQFHAKDDHLVPIAVAREVRDGLRAASEAHNAAIAEEGGSSSGGARRSTYVYVETANDGHFQDDDYEEVMWSEITKVLPFVAAP